LTAAPGVYRRECIKQLDRPSELLALLNLGMLILCCSLKGL
jgi:hypothetical protein